MGIALVSMTRLLVVGLLGVTLGTTLGGCAGAILSQSADEVVVRVADKPDLYAVRPVAKAYAQYAILAAQAYDDPGVSLRRLPRTANGRAWQQVPLQLTYCPEGALCAGEVGVQLWIARDNSGICRQAAVVFRGTVASSLDDWIANFRWFNALLPVYDYYDQARYVIARIVKVAQSKGCGGNIIAVGHSLGGGLAQHVAYAQKNIKTVYAFDPSFVIGIADFHDQNLEPYNKNRYFDYVYEHGEILAPLRFIVRQFSPYSACDPQIRTVRFNTLSGSWINQHRIKALAEKMTDIALHAPPAVAHDPPLLSDYRLKPLPCKSVPAKSG